MKPEQSRRARRERRPGTRSSLPLLASGLIAVALALAGGCVGTIGDPPDESSCTTCPPKPGGPTAAALDTSRFPRLSHLQWENSIQDLLYLAAPTGISAWR